MNLWVSSQWKPYSHKHLFGSYFLFYRNRSKPYSGNHKLCIGARHIDTAYVSTDWVKWIFILFSFCPLLWGCILCSGEYDLF